MSFSVTSESDLDHRSTSASDGLHNMEQSEAVQQWRAQFEAKISEKNASEVAAMDQWRRAAAQEFSAWLRNHEDELARNKRLNRDSQEAYLQDREQGAHGGEWHRVAILCDLAAKSGAAARPSLPAKDVSRMRGILGRLGAE
ncbi:hypothetical protein BOX15_Mlig015891g3 [Macrostomum lignano]|uniref:Clathrin light chain n=1 Tax=Macrostomum lignano TaxID=282301 RepID=A0A267DFF0_9PLAT|nr:hypothetical protein BOX15_Mlig015891g3 [Macrostomum lignano]